MEGRICTQCNQKKPADQFSWRRGKNNKRLTSRCLACRRKNYHDNPLRARKAAKEYHQKHRDSIRKRVAKKRRLRPAWGMLVAAKSRAKKSGVPFDLTENDIFVPAYCPALGIPIVVGEGKCGPNSPSLDRIDPRLGYVKGNVIVVSHRANTIKSDATISDILRVAHFYQQLAEGL